MPRSATTGVFTRVSNSFSNPVFGTLIDPTDADALFDDQDVGLNPPNLAGPLNVINPVTIGKAGTTVGTLGFFNATSGSITLSPPTGALGTVTLTLPAATDTLVGKNTTDVLNNKSMNGPVINGGLVNALTGFSLRDTSAAFNLTFTATSSPALTANRALTFNMNDAGRTVNLAGDVTIAAGGFTTAGGFSTTLTTTGSTNVTLPTTGTLMTLGGNETITGVKTFGAAGNVGKLVVAGNTSGSTILNATAVASGTLTLPAATDTLVGRATTDTLTNKTLTSPTLTTPTLGVASATSLVFSPTTNGIIGTTTNDNAPTGTVGEYIESDILSGSAVSLSTGVSANLTSISLTAGDWDVGGGIVFNAGGTTTISQLVASTNTTSATLPTSPGKGSTFNMVLPFTTGNSQVIPLGTRRYSLSGTTTVFAVAQAVFGVSTMSVFGILWARRRR